MVCERRAIAQALVESALVIPLAILLSLSLLQVVLYVHALDVLTTAAQEGARLAAEDGRSADDGLDRAQTLVAAGLGQSVAPLVVHVTLDEQLVTVEASAAMRPILPLPVGDGLPLHVVSRVSRERFRPGGAA
jgi:Flp pilus assembly protein TadG